MTEEETMTTFQEKLCQLLLGETDTGIHFYEDMEKTYLNMSLACTRYTERLKAKRCILQGLLRSKSVPEKPGLQAEVEFQMDKGKGRALARDTVTDSGVIGMLAKHQVSTVTG